MMFPTAKSRRWQVTGQADFIVTGDRNLLTLSRIEGLAILTPGSFLVHFDIGV
jgi:predicted nucleic acid-binding protein